MDTINALADKMDVIGICETWCKEDDQDLLNMMDEYVNTERPHPRCRGYGGVGLIVNPIIKYTLIEKCTTKTHQHISIQIGNVMIVIIYISPITKAPETMSLLDGIKAYARGDTIIIGDLNARNRSWDSSSNSKGIMIKNWAEIHNWEIHNPCGKTCVTPNGSSSPDMGLTKGIDIIREMTTLNTPQYVSDHKPIVVEINIRKPRVQKQREVPIRHRNNPKYMRNAMIHYEEKLPTLINNLKKCLGKEELEQRYSEFKTIMLQPWNYLTTSRPNRYKSFWTPNLDRLSKVRKTLYRKAKTTGLEDDWKQYNKIDREIKSRATLNQKNSKKGSWKS